MLVSGTIPSSRLYVTLGSPSWDVALIVWTRWEVRSWKARQVGIKNHGGLMQKTENSPQLRKSSKSSKKLNSFELLKHQKEGYYSGLEGMVFNLGKCSYSLSCQEFGNTLHKSVRVMDPCPHSVFLGGRKDVVELCDEALVCWEEKHRTSVLSNNISTTGAVWSTLHLCFLSDASILRMLALIL